MEEEEEEVVGTRPIHVDIEENHDDRDILEPPGRVGARRDSRVCSSYRLP